MTGPGWGQLRAKVRRAAEAAVKAGAAQMLRDVGDTLDAASPGSGRVYTRGGRAHQASAPGQPWASDTGNARQAMTADYRGGNGDVLAARVGPATAATSAPGGGQPDNYVRDLEYGTRTVAARPTLRPTAQREKDAVQNVMKRAFAREMNR